MLITTCQESMPRLVLRRLLSRQKGLEAPLASGFSINKKGAFLPLYVPSRKASLCWIKPRSLGTITGLLLFSVLYRLALVCLPHVYHSPLPSLPDIPDYSNDYIANMLGYIFILSNNS